MDKNHRMERGQALVLIILGIVGMLGFSALAVDFGRVYAERRRAQSAVDAAALSAAYAASQEEDEANRFTKAEVAARTTLGKNDYFEVAPVTIRFANPPESGPYIDDNEYYQVIIENEVAPIFAHFVFEGLLEIQVEAVAHSRPETSISAGNAITALDRELCPGIVFEGNVSTTVTGGNIFSNSPGIRDEEGEDASHGNCYSAIATGNSGNITVNEGQVVVANSYEGYPVDSTENPGLVQDAGQQTFPPVPEPYCDDLPVGDADTDTHILHAGRHTTSPLNLSGDWVMEQGMHCFYTDLTKNGGKLQSSGYGVFIVMKEGGISFGGNSNIRLKAIYAGPDGNGYKDKGGTGNQWSGMLMYMSPENDDGIDLSGNSGSSYTGTIYAPGRRDPDSKQKCILTGTTDGLALHSALICSTVGISGNSTINIVYREKENFRLPPSVELSQ